MRGDRPTTRSNKRHALMLLIAFLITFFVGDQILSRVRLPRVYGSTNPCRWKWELYEEYRQTPDVVFLGCSCEWFGIHPKILDAEAGRLLGRPITSLNLSTSAVSILTESLLVRRMVESGRLPKLVYLGIGTSSATVALYPWLRPGLRAFGDARDLPLVSRCDPKLLSDALPAALFRSYYQWNDCRLIAERVAIGAPLLPPTKLIEDERGWAHWVGDPLHPRPNDVLPTGPAVSQADNPNVPALRRALAALREAGVPVVLLEMPLPSIAPPHMSLDNRAYSDFLEVVAETTDAPILRPPNGYITDDDFFDHVHLTVAGAEKYSRWLAGHVAETLRETTPHPPDDSPTVATASAQRQAP